MNLSITQEPGHAFEATIDRLENQEENQSRRNRGRKSTEDLEGIPWVLPRTSQALFPHTGGFGCSIALDWIQCWREST